MSIHVALHHRTTYKYDALINVGPQVVRLRPAPHSRTRILSYSLRVSPEPHFINWQQDPQSNYLARLVFPEKTRKFEVEVDLVAEMSVLNPFDFFLEPSAERCPFQYDHALDHELAAFRQKLPLTPLFEKFVESARREWVKGGEPAEGETDHRVKTNDFIVGLNQKVWHELKYVIRLEPGVQTPEETLERGNGSCRDSAWLLVQLFRHLGLAARFVSGYLIQLTADVKSLDGPSGPEQDFTDLHAWCEVYLPGAGWIGLDATSGLLAGEGHIPLAATPDPQSAAPISGLIDECKVEFEHDMRVSRIYESPRVTKPYTREQWSSIEALGHQLDRELKAADCRLTMGGEPTFVSIDDMEGPEWNTTAHSPAKKKLADGLLRRLKNRFSEGALIHHGQGKWYPGEQLPRWAFGCYWRKDGEPIWANPALFAEEERDYGYNEKDAHRFMESLATRLGCGAKWIIPAYEDTWYYLWKERRLPSNVDPFKSNLKDEMERARIARLFEQGIDKTVGYVLPLQRGWRNNSPGWVSGQWFLRSERCYLIPGDSPIGFRLPMDSIPWVAEKDYPFVHEQDPLDKRGALPSRQGFLRSGGPTVSGAAPSTSVYARGGAGRTLPGGGTGGTVPGAMPAIEPSERIPKHQESADWVIRTALCVESRGGRLYVFMPPARTLEDYLDAITAVEQTAEALGMPVLLEGYQPPHDARLKVIKVTPDPGVIEVNIHPSHTWAEMVATTTGLYEDARLSRLGTEKFMTDGRHTGTGGGNHIVIGGETPQDSPLLRRPDLLRSLVTYWQNHPSLSFLFSGLFIGPTSQSPRIDEARNDSLYELEVAFRQLPGSAKVSPWLVDRLFRNLLVDSTGNTHRAEFCIDKLYSPDSSSGRLGLLELRGFEMPPHAEMSLAQQLLLRTLIGRFWREPYQQDLVRWGTDIHDRWMLPHFVWSDFADVISDLNERGYPIRSEWFAPHFEFRFPQHGDLDLKNLHLEVRHALEPWHVLGEEGAAGGAVRYVDSSVERVQIKAQGLTGSRHIIACNGYAVPLHPTGTNGEFVAGVRYRAWQPPNCLHPGIGVHSPLVFDVVDSWNSRSIGGCTYHVMHPGGRSYSTFPVNSYEAESRRLARFFRFGHTPGRMAPAKAVPNGETPFTLDLRAV